ncbi:hypothetical protein DFQ14_10369 [Halopolyspora algeriensis]|uniref:Uncharacterized protein n=1 Tax=Halopolyspora algeriensis TaxID=1500506 RepID=A0A368VUZ0_9ACTN|nr:hypothetical protein [Halopolyspora algeriensis]RCW45106.1 hypothetical protein DFQ14_10369 [Halopolyspora algeriensis]TQM53172.1 hypothetical protein FHU43_2555 [Halopolyspora algeriensis]
MTVVEILLVLVVTPAAIYGLVTLLVLWPRLARNRYRAGQEWDFDPVFWVADPEGVSTTSPPADEGTTSDAQLSTARGGARGNW